MTERQKEHFKLGRASSPPRAATGVLGGQGYAILPNLMSSAEAVEARAFAIAEASRTTSRVIIVDTTAFNVNDDFTPEAPPDSAVGHFESEYRGPFRGQHAIRISMCASSSPAGREM
jgi:hypothetical protein